MEKKLVRLISIILIVILIINIFLNSAVFAVDKLVGLDQPFTEMKEHSSTNGVNATEEYSETGKSPITGQNGDRIEDISPPSSAGNTAVSILVGIIIIIPEGISRILEGIVNQGSGTSGSFTIQNLLSGKYSLFNVNIFQQNTSNEYAIDLIKSNIAIWYYAIRNICVGLALVTLIYIGIRMAISSVAEQRARYKKMLADWLIGFILMFFIHYIFIFVMNISDAFIDLIGSAMGGTDSFEGEIFNNTADSLWAAAGWNKLAFAFVFIMLLIYQIKFFIMYLTRLLKTVFLITISPLVCLTYPIDKVKDNKAQAFNNWISEILITILIQPVHLILYVVFVFSASEIAKEIPILGAIFIMLLSNGEKIVRRSFKFKATGLNDIKLKGIPGLKK